jgi:hypothetical protein
MGLAQNSEFPSDPASFSKEDFSVLKKTLEQCIPFIRFYNLTSNEFKEKVLPYKKIIPKELYKDLLNTFLSLSDGKLSDKSNPRTSRITKEMNLEAPHITEDINLKIVDSRIITNQHVELISKWIDKLEITDKLKNSYEFKLLFRRSRDGFTHRKFCYNKTRTVTIFKVKNSDEILGGFNPIEWKYYNDSLSVFNMYIPYYYGTTKDSFIFSFKNSNRIGEGNYVLSRVSDENKAIYNYYACGPSFGNGDLITSGLSGCSCRKTSYEKPIRETDGRFFIEECEIFQIM